MSAYTDREARAVERFENLSNEFTAALMAGPTSSLHVPGYSEPPSIADYIAAQFDDQGICDLLRIVIALARDGDRRAQAWIKREADLYAAAHGTRPKKRHTVKGMPCYSLAELGLTATDTEGGSHD